MRHKILESDFGRTSLIHTHTHTRLLLRSKEREPCGDRGGGPLTSRTTASPAAAFPLILATCFRLRKAASRSLLARSHRADSGSHLRTKFQALHEGGHRGLCGASPISSNYCWNQEEPQFLEKAILPSLPSCSLFPSLPPFPPSRFLPRREDRRLTKSRQRSRRRGQR